MLPIVLIVALSAAASVPPPSSSSLDVYKRDGGPYLCNYAKVYRLAPRHRLSVRSRPGKHYRKVDTLAVGAPIYICNSRGPWLKVYFGKGAEPCGGIESDGMDSRKVGACRTGWVDQDWVDVISG